MVLQVKLVLLRQQFTQVTAYRKCVTEISRTCRLLHTFIESSSKWLQKVTCRVRCRAWSKLPAVQCQLFCFTSSMNKSTGCLYQQARQLFLTGLQKQHLNLSGFSYLTGSGRLAKSLIPEQCMGQRKMSSILWVNPIFNWWKFRKLLPRR